jgi:hypothetical protein
MIVFSPYPVPVLVENDKQGWLLYVESGDQYANDVWTIIHKEGGIVRHYQTSQVRIMTNATFNIEKEQNKI